jgi:2',3'-cyclic-nucleotide 2'-phosphodiesterase (5'-nucleotidase family)
MTGKLWRVLVSCLLVLAVPLAAAPPKAYLTILHTNDTHSSLFPFGPQDSWGGIARMSEKIKEIRRDGGNVLVLNTGDVFVGTFEFNK